MSQDPYASSGTPVHPTTTTDKDQLVLILAGLSFLLCGPFTAIPGAWIARQERLRVQRGELAPNSNLDVGYWLCIANIVLTVVSIFFLVLLFGAGFLIAWTGPR